MRLDWKVEKGHLHILLLDSDSQGDIVESEIKIPCGMIAAEAAREKSTPSPDMWEPQKPGNVKLILRAE